MKYRRFGKTDWQVSEIGLGTWQVGGKWGSGFSFDNAASILECAIEEGINFIDTADVYEAGLSETAVGKAVRSADHKIYVATKCGRQIIPHENQYYTPDVLERYVDQSLLRLGLEQIDLIQLHCPPSEVYARDEIFERFIRLREKGKIAHMGVSVEKIDEALQALNYEVVSSVQIIFNIFRQRPAAEFFAEAKKRDVAIISRVPLASGLLTGLYSADTVFGKEDHRSFNRNGEAFDKGETFSGVPYEVGLQAVAEIKKVAPDLDNLIPLALSWILSHEEVSCVIPGVSRVGQLDSIIASENYGLSSQAIDQLGEIYDRHIREWVHESW